MCHVHIQYLVIASSMCMLPLLWNALPQHVKDTENVLHFKKLLKTYFFTQAFFSCFVI